MIFDKQSFLAGLHTGLRLGRDPIGRRPPPPQRRYIIREDGKKILFTEVKSSAGATIYGMKDEYNAIYYSAEGEIVDTGVMRWYRSVYKDGKYEEAESKVRAILVFWSGASGATEYYWVLFSDNRKDFQSIPDLIPPDHVTYVLSMILDGEGRTVGGSVTGVSYNTTPDGYYYSLSFVDTNVGRVRPEGVDPLILDSGVSLRQAVEDFVDSYFDESEPMITEDY